MKCTWPTRDPTQTIFHWLAFGVCIWSTQILAFALGVMQISAFLDTNMLVCPTETLALGVLPNAMAKSKSFCVAVEYRLYKSDFSKNRTIPRDICDQEYLLHTGVQYIKSKLIKYSFKCKRNYLVFIDRYAFVGLLICILALNVGEILRVFGEISWK